MIKKQNGLTIIELIVVMSIIAILAAVGAPQYGRFISKNRVKRASNDLLQNMRLARTMAIKENRTYLITFNENAGENIYRIGIDGGGNGSLLDNDDEYGNGTGAPVRVINVQTEYGNTIILGSAAFTTNPPNDPDAVAMLDATSFNFNTDGSVGVTPANSGAYLQEDYRGYTFGVVASSTVKVDLYMWLGDADNTGDINWLELR